MATLAAAGIHDPSFMPFAHPWTDVEPPELQRTSLQFYWRRAPTLTVEQWDLPFAVLVDGAVVGATSIGASHFALTKTFQTGSWLGRAHQGQGLGKELRAATLHLGFEGFGAEVAETEAFEDNAPSLGVTRSLGYADNGVGRHKRRETSATILRFRMTAEHWRAMGRDDIELHGVDAALPLLGLDHDIGPDPITLE